MTLINPRAITNKTGVTYEAGSLTKIYAEDYLIFKHALGSSGSEIFPWIYNVSTTVRDTLTTYGSGHIIYNTTVGSLQVYRGGTWENIGGGGVIDHGNLTGLTDDDHTQYMLVNGTRTGSNLIVSGSVVATTLVGSSSNYIPHGIIPYGSLANALPQGVLPIGSVPSLTSLYIPQGQLPTGSLPTNILVSGSITAGSFVGDGGNLNNVGPRTKYMGSSFSGTNGASSRAVTHSTLIGSNNMVFVGYRVQDFDLEYTVTSGSVLTITGPLYNDDVVLLWNFK